MNNIKENAIRWKAGFRTALKCKKCNDVIYSTHSGEFVMCLCKSIFIDQTLYYARMGGEPDDMEFFEININDQNSIDAIK